MNQNIESEVPLHKKRKNNSSKSKKKSSHKHDYRQVLYHYYNETAHTQSTVDRYCLGRLCTVCGKQVIDRLWDTVKVEDKPYHRMLTNKEFYEKHKHLDIIERND